MNAAGSGHEAASRRAAEADRIALLAELGGIVVAFKPARAATEPTPQSADCLVHRIAALLGVASVHAASRLDVGVSGLVLCTIGPRAAQRIAALRAAGRLHHHYLGVVAGRIEEGGRWSEPIGRTRDGAGRARALIGGPHARAALTQYEVLGHAGPLATALRLTIATGRMHQIRVHGSGAGHPLLGDRRYGGRASVVASEGRVIEVPRPALHCACVELGELGRFESPLPADLRALWRAIGGADEIWDGPDNDRPGT